MFALFLCVCVCALMKICRKNHKIVLSAISHERKNVIDYFWPTSNRRLYLSTILGTPNTTNPMDHIILGTPYNKIPMDHINLTWQRYILTFLSVGPALNQARSLHSCSLLNYLNPDSGLVERFLVIGGGQNEVYQSLTSVEILNLVTVL